LRLVFKFGGFRSTFHSLLRHLIDIPIAIALFPFNSRDMLRPYRKGITDNVLNFAITEQTGTEQTGTEQTGTEQTGQIRLPIVNDGIAEGAETVMVMICWRSSHGRGRVRLQIVETAFLSKAKQDQD
jgi:hypothetical protein